jgi:hypothetical protein
MPHRLLPGGSCRETRAGSMPRSGSAGPVRGRRLMWCLCQCRGRLWRRSRAGRARRSVSPTRRDKRSRPARARTWAPRGHTPVVKVTGKGSGRISIAGLVCYRPGPAIPVDLPDAAPPWPQGREEGFREPNLAALLDAAHQPARRADRVGLGQPRRPHLHPHAAIGSHQRLATCLPAAVLCARAQPCRIRVVTPETQPGQPRRRYHQPPRSTGPHPAERMQYIPGLVDGFLAGTRLVPP